MYNTSITRISGMSSGLDTDSIVKKLMDAESVRLNKMKQDQQKYEWESDGYRQWNSDLFSFRSDNLFKMKMSSAYGTYDVTSSNSVNTDVATGTATADAIAGTYKLQVDQIAQSATMVSNVNIDSTAVLSAGSFTISTVDGAGAPHTATISVNGTSEKIGDLVSKLNTAKDASGNSLDIQATYDSTLKQFILKTKDTGAGTSIKVTGDSGLFGGTLNFSGSNNSLGVSYDNPTSTYSSLTGVAGNQYSAADASFTFNGTAATSKTNNVSIMGVNYTLKNVSPKDAANNPIPNTITVSRNIDQEVKNIKDFIDKYNDILGKLNTADSEPVYRDYQPLTDDQRSSMSDSQIEKWETKAKSGLFRNDSILTNLVNNMRNHITSTVSTGSKYNSLASIGIESSSWEDQGKLYVDETKLRAALQDDPDAIKNLFTQDPDPKNPTPGGRGIIPQLYDDFSNAVKQLTDKAGSTGSSQSDQSVVGKLLGDLNKRIDDEQQRLVDKENQYYSQFTAMETAMSKYNSQSSWLGQQLGIGSK
ncbi:MAG TPA: flagellar filament capping protein FliD [Bacillota bacterium]|nr:flagellar filament capping protein FliD [Bacillota bacterium]